MRALCLYSQVLQQYESGAGGYSTRIGSGVYAAAAAAAANEDNDDDIDFDLDQIRPRVILEESLTPIPSPSPEGKECVIKYRLKT